MSKQRPAARHVRNPSAPFCWSRGIDFRGNVEYRLFRRTQDGKRRFSFLTITPKELHDGLPAFVEQLRKSKRDLRDLCDEYDLKLMGVTQ
jgi:hypothetical protein